MPPCGFGGGPCTVGALLGGCQSPGRLVPWDCDAELSAFCTTACSRRPRSPWRTLLPSRVDGSGIALRRSAAAIMFWLAVLKIRGTSPPSSSMMRRLTSRARRLASPPSPRADLSYTRVSRSWRRRMCSSMSLASSSLSCSRSVRHPSVGAEAAPRAPGWIPGVVLGGGVVFLCCEGPAPP